MQTVEISFQGSDDDGSLVVSIRNPNLLPTGLYHQLTRYGLRGPTSQKPYLSGRSNSTRKALTELIQTYGCTLNVIPAVDGLVELDRR